MSEKEPKLSWPLRIGFFIAWPMLALTLLVVIAVVFVAVWLLILTGDIKLTESSDA